MKTLDRIIRFVIVSLTPPPRILGNTPPTTEPPRPSHPPPPRMVRVKVWTPPPPPPPARRPRKAPKPPRDREVSQKAQGPTNTAVQFDVDERRVMAALGPGMSDAGKKAWLRERCVFLDGRIPLLMLRVGEVDEVLAAVEQLNQGDYA